LRFAKYEGTGNDFVMIEDLDDAHPIDARTARALCDRRFGVGADGVIRITRHGEADFFMDYRNSDGSLAQMCGNGARCLGKLVFERGLTGSTEIDVMTRAGSKHLSLVTDGPVVREVTVQMGPPSFAKGDIPMQGEPTDTFLQEPMDLGQLTVKASALSMGNPHLVLFMDSDPADAPVATIGPMLEHHRWFPEKTNVEFAHVMTDEIVVRVWERGSGETLACGTGACAVAVAANEAGLAPAVSQIQFPGGVVRVERLEDQVLLTGPASKVFEGELDERSLAGER
jgi:diaminopimelate epimerase